MRYTLRLERVLVEALGDRFRPHVPRAIAAARRRYARTFLPGYDPADIDPGPLPAMVLTSME